MTYLPTEPLSEVMKRYAVKSDLCSVTFDVGRFHALMEDESFLHHIPALNIARRNIAEMTEYQAQLKAKAEEVQEISSLVSVLPDGPAMEELLKAKEQENLELKARIAELEQRAKNRNAGYIYGYVVNQGSGESVVKATTYKILRQEPPIGSIPLYTELPI